jgi:hypothetical protein
LQFHQPLQIAQGKQLSLDLGTPQSFKLGISFLEQEFGALLAPTPMKWTNITFNSQPKVSDVCSYCLGFLQLEHSTAAVHFTAAAVSEKS